MCCSLAATQDDLGLLDTAPQLVSSCDSGSSDFYSSEMLYFGIGLTMSPDLKLDGELHVVLAQEAWKTSAAWVISTSIWSTLAQDIASVQQIFGTITSGHLQS